MRKSLTREARRYYSKRPLHPATPDHYATLGLDRRATLAQIRSAYRLLARQLHPDVNAGSADSIARTQALNAAHETLSEPARRRAYDRELAAADRESIPIRSGRIERDISQDVSLRLAEFLCGTHLEIRVNDPANSSGPEVYALVVPPDTAPGARLRIPRDEPGGTGFVIVRMRARPDARFKLRGSDLRCDLRISSQRAAQGGSESIRGVTGNFVRVEIPRGVARGEIIRVLGEGLPKARGSRGDLLARIIYRPEVRVARTSGGGRG